MSLSSKRLLIATLRLTFGLLAATAILSQLLVHMTEQLSLLNFFSYFTNLSNIIALIVLVWSGVYDLVCPDKPSRMLAVARAAATVYMVIVGVVFSLLLRDVDLGSLQPWVNIVLHYVMPIVVAVDWLLLPPKQPIGYKQVLASLAFPFLYLVYSLVRGPLSGFYAYPFINPDKLGYGSVVVYCLLILGLFMATSFLVAWTGRRIKRHTNLRRT